MTGPSLQGRISAALPKGVHLTIHHCAALPTSTDPLFVAAPGADPEATELESHFLSASIRTDDALVQVFAIEVLAYTTARLTTLFVSKADSTGYLHLLNLPAGTPSPLRAVLAQFLVHLIEAKKQTKSRLVLSLFARAQDQYLFPGSIENSKKHVLDDRALIKWWARIMDDIFLSYAPNVDKSIGIASAQNDFHVRGHLVVPGVDRHETKSFIPRDAAYKTSHFWHITDPLKSLGQPEDVPERCLVPRFPDDPKARYAVELDGELPTITKSEDDKESTPQPVCGPWRSVKSLDTFWEFMSYRQECSAGRLTGFLWGIWEPTALVGKPYQATHGEKNEIESTKEKMPLKQQSASLVHPTEEASISGPLPESAYSSSETPALKSLPILDDSQKPTTIVQEPSYSEQDCTGRISSSCKVHLPPVDVVEPRAVPPLVKPAEAEVTLSTDAYARAMELLLELDYCDLPTAISSTRHLLCTIKEEGGILEWGIEAVGTKEHSAPAAKPAAGEINSLVGLVRKRPKQMSPDMVRKKPKAS